jgi:hypothetical protein
MGSVGMDVAPAKIISREQTVANTGRRMKKLTMTFRVLLRAGGCRPLKAHIDHKERSLFRINTAVERTTPEQV